MPSSDNQIDPTTRAEMALLDAQRMTEPITRAGTCGYCGQPATTVDHVTPKARGGADDEGNLMAACLSCNSGKRDR